MKVREVLALVPETLVNAECLTCKVDHVWSLNFMRDQHPAMDLAHYPLQEGQESIRVVLGKAGGGKQPCGSNAQFSFTHKIAGVV